MGEETLAVIIDYKGHTTMFNSIIIMVLVGSTLDLQYLKYVFLSFFHSKPIEMILKSYCN